MTKYAAFDVSVNESALCILDADGNIVEESKVPSEADALAEALRQHRAEIGLVGLKASPMSKHLFDGLAEAVYPVVCCVNRSELSGGSNVWETGAYGKGTNRKQYPTQLCERAVRIVRENEGEYASRWAALTSIAGKVGCNPATLRNWMRQAERDEGTAAGMTTSDQARLKELERENKELERANEIPRKASAYFAQAELDRRHKP